MSNDQSENDLIEKLAATWPKAFFVNQDARRPLKLGIRGDMAAQPHGLTDAELRRALGQYCRSSGYLTAMVAGAERIDLNGMPAGTVTAEAVRSKSSAGHCIVLGQLWFRARSRADISPRISTPPCLCRRAGLVVVRSSRRCFRSA